MPEGYYKALVDSRNNCFRDSGDSMGSIRERINKMNKSITRRIIALMFCFCGAGVMSYLAIKGIVEAFTALNTIVSLIVGFYFGVQAQKLASGDGRQQRGATGCGGCRGGWVGGCRHALDFGGDCYFVYV